MHYVLSTQGDRMTRNTRNLTKRQKKILALIGEHGIYVVRGPYSGCFLPEVATDQGWDAEQFLTQCCTGKAGLPPDAWRDKDTKVYLFTSEKFDH